MIDQLTHQLAQWSDRRTVARLLAGASIAGIVRHFSADTTEAACTAVGKRCSDQRSCCRDSICKGGRCRCKPGRIACFAGKWGHKGSDNGEFDQPDGVAVGTDGQVYVADTYNHRVQVFTATGKFLGTWGSQGGGTGQFNYPRGLAVGADGAVYVADTFNHRIQKFDGNGGHLLTWGSFGTGNDQFKFPDGVAVHDDGVGNVTVYVADTDNFRIQRFTGSGVPQGSWGGEGTNPGQFMYPFDVAVDADGFVYVADSLNHRVQKFQGNGTFLTMWGKNGGDGTMGTGDGEFSQPEGLAVNAAGFVFVADTSNARVQVFTRHAGFVGKWGHLGRAPGELKYPRAVAVDDSDNVYVPEDWTNRVQRFRLA
jgi:sugar lactone lactonase YvrE